MIAAEAAWVLFEQHIRQVLRDCSAAMPEHPVEDEIEAALVALDETNKTLTRHFTEINAARQ